ncbi:uncharacterized protein LOC122798680 [Protopterus annectens]|uniref:uncharacterized protein LOC122798680 n=1 Tax=Protopterus annectens TaxID=7888 RepID=UPI001CF9682C|nr:uncharacterized protein LOC122798680 [Protopterus annectens]
MNAFVKQRQQEISRQLIPTVQACMKPAYAACAEIKGQCCLRRITQRMCKFIHSTKERMFSLVEDRLKKELKLLQNEIHNRLELKMKDLHKSLTVQFEPLLKFLKKNNVTIHELAHIYRQVSEICQNSNIEFKLNDLNEEDEECLPSTSETEKSNTCTQELHFSDGVSGTDNVDGNLFTKIYHINAPCTKELHFYDGSCGMDNEDGNTFTKIYHIHTQTCHKEKNIVAATPNLESSVSSIPCKNKYSKSVGVTIYLSGHKRGPDSLQTPAVPSKIKITLHGQQPTDRETHITICSSEDEEEANSSGGQTSSQTDMHPTSAAETPPQNKPGSSDIQKTKSKQ